MRRGAPRRMKIVLFSRIFKGGDDIGGNCWFTVQFGFGDHRGGGNLNDDTSFCGEDTQGV
ncbi:hypothetical protein [Candidatus Hakubella thermalkaliphila]|uniref:hypothetical protein n=1 Tax=Candidatus Hakubella thermalkaliphila TaxID=2754717 RepID=UPI002158F9E2|nr:hypothetical protein [Candidatus Hakubella thermalkaliphila]